MIGTMSRVMEYDPFSQEFQADPFPVYRWMRDEAPVFHSEKWNWWALSRFEDVRAAATDPRTFGSYEGIDIDDTAKDQSGPGFLPDIDNPRHDQIRRMIQPQLLPNRIAEREDAVRAVVRGLVDAWRHRGTVDLAQELAWPMPNEVFFDLLGLPAARQEGRAQLERWVHELKDRKLDDARLTPVAKAATAGMRIDEQVAFFVAKHIRSNVRELEGALKRILAYANFHGGEINLALAKDALRDLLAVQNRQISIDNIQKTVADYYKIRISDMYSKKRSRAIARPRQVAMALAKELTQHSLPEIGSNFGGRDHTTVLHACRQIAKLRESQHDLNHDVNFLLQVLRS